MRNSIEHGRRVALRVVALQAGAAIAAGLVGCGFGGRAAVAALAGGLIVAAGSVLFAVRMFGRHVVPAREALHSAYAAEVLKWTWLCAALFFAIAVWKLPFLALIGGVLAAQFAFWIALFATR